MEDKRIKAISGLSLNQYKTSKCSLDLQTFIDNLSRDSVG